MKTIEKDPLQTRLEITNWILLAALLVAGLLLTSRRFTLGILSGGLISVINFHWLYRNLTGVFSSRTSRVKTALILRYYLRLALTAFALYWLISREAVDLIGLVLGLSVVVLNIMLTTVLALSKKNCLEEVR